MGYNQGWNTFVGTAKQTSIATKVAPTKFQTQTDVSINLQKSDQQRIPANRKTRGYAVSIEGRTMVEGNISGPVMPDEIMGGYGFAQLYGNNNTVTGSAGVGFTHVFNEQESCGDYPTAGATYSVYKGDCSYDTTMQFDYVGVFIKSITLTFPESGAVTYDAAFVGKATELGGTVATPSFTTKNPVDSWMVKLEMGTTISTLTTYEFVSGDWSKDLLTTMIQGGNSQTPVAAAYPDIDEVQANFTFNLQNDATIYNYWANKTEVAMKITITHDQKAGTASGFYSWTTEMPRGILDGSPPDISGTGLQTMTLNFKAMKHLTLGYTSKETIVNSESGTYEV